MGHKDYSGTPLAKKLGIKEGSRVVLVNAPSGFEEALEPLPDDVILGRRTRREADVIVHFATKESDVARRFPGLAGSLVPDGRLWVAYPKRASGVATDLTFENVQTIGLHAGLVDNKSIAVDEVYSGVQFVYRRKDRPR